MALSDAVTTPARLKQWSDVAEGYRRWELDLLELEGITGMKFDDSMKTSALMRLIPLDLRNLALAQNGLEDEFSKIRDYVLNQTGRRTAVETNVPMDIGALNREGQPEEDDAEDMDAFYFKGKGNIVSQF